MKEFYIADDGIQLHAKLDLSLIHIFFAKMLDKTEFRMDQIEKQLGKGFLNATDIAEHFAKQGIPFREAHAIVGHMVKACEKKGCDLEDLTDEELQDVYKRQEYAQKLLKESEDEVGTVAWKCGYPDGSYFTREFRKMYGFTPSQFRRITR